MPIVMHRHDIPCLIYSPLSLIFSSSCRLSSRASFPSFQMINSLDLIESNSYICPGTGFREQRERRDDASCGGSYPETDQVARRVQKVQRTEGRAPSTHVDERLTTRHGQIKCDERSPSCSQCSRRNYACPGYGRRVQWFQLREISAAGDLVTRSHRSPRTKHDRVKSKGQSPVEKHPQDELCDNTLLTTNLHKSSLSFCDTTTHLVEYYFSNVCPIISCFDSPSNPFRYEISNMMRTSKTVFCCIQAMSAAHLSMLQPSRIQERIGTQNHAIKLVSKDINALVNVDEKVLVSVILLGVSDVSHPYAESILYDTDVLEAMA